MLRITEIIRPDVCVVVCACARKQELPMSMLPGLLHLQSHHGRYVTVESIPLDEELRIAFVMALASDGLLEWE